MQTAVVGETREAPVTFRRGAQADNYAAFLVLELAIADLVRRFGSTEPMSADDPAALARMWKERQPLYDFLAAEADQFWAAERDGHMIGYARSVLYGDMQELTELFVMPGSQSKGVGRGLLERAFPPGPRRRFIIASPDFRAQRLYMKTELYPRGTIHYFACTPAIVDVHSDIGVSPLTAPDADTLANLGAIDEAVLGFRRESTHRWLIETRQGHVYTRSGRPVGYGYTGLRNGPFALLDHTDFPAVIAHAETEAASAGRDFGLEVPLLNRTAVDYLIDRGYRVDPFAATFLSNFPGDFMTRYIVTSPPFIL